MLCPVCKNVPIEDKELELGLKGYICSQCGGNWVRYKDYEEWKIDAGARQFALSNVLGYYLEYDNKKASFCPDCGRLLIKYKVSGSLPFYVDHCGTCNGLWLDKSEWEGIVKNNLQYKVNDFFTSPWQAKIRKEMTKQRFEEGYIKKFGQENYTKLREIREWINSSNQKQEMIAYLVDDDPYRI